MRTAQLGRGGPRISRLGVGGFQAGGTGPWGAGPNADDDAAIAAIRAAIDGGVTWVETAASYGLGHAEEVVGRAITPWRAGEEVLVFSKCGHPWEPPDRIWTELAPATIRRQCDESLGRLGIERIDLYMFHHADPKTPVEDSWRTLGELVDEGKVRWAGVSNFDVGLLERCDAIRHVDVLSPELSPVVPDASSDVIPWCREHGTGVIVYSPQAGGLLSKGGDPATLSDDERRGMSAETLGALQSVLRSIGEHHGVGPGAVAVAWALAVDGVAGAICGARTPTQVEGWIAASEIELTDEELRGIDAAASGGEA